jgi:AcrR family transcriptional regulator
LLVTNPALLEDGQDPAAAAAYNARAAHRSRQLLDAAARLMERQGSAGVSMQAVAAEAGVSVGLIYRYFGSKDDLLLAVIVEVLDAFATAVPEAIEAAGPDPVRRLANAFRAYCEVIDRHQHATVLTYRESKSLTAAGREHIMTLEVQTSEPLREVLREGLEAGVFEVEDVELASYNLLLFAHSWALKHWYFERTVDFDTYVRRQTASALRSLLAPRQRRRYADLIGPWD